MNAPIDDMMTSFREILSSDNLIRKYKINMYLSAATEKMSKVSKEELEQLRKNLEVLITSHEGKFTRPRINAVICSSECKRRVTYIFQLGRLPSQHPGVPHWHPHKS